VVDQLFPELKALIDVPQEPEWHPEGDVWIHTLLLLEKLPAGVSRTLAWGSLPHDVGKPPTFRRAADRIRFDGHVEVGVAMAREICQRLRMSKDDIEQILALVDNHMRFADTPRMKASTLKRFMRLARFDEHLELHRLDCMSSHENLELYNLVSQKLLETPGEEIRPDPLIGGDDLIALGFAPGPVFREILSAVEDQQLEGSIKSREEAIGFVRSNYKPQ